MQSERRMPPGNLPPQEATSLCNRASSGDPADAFREIMQCTDLRTARYSQITQMRRRINLALIESPAVKIWIAGTVSVHPMVPAIEVGLLHHGFKAHVKCGGFNTLHQDFLDASSDLYCCAPDFVVLAYDLPHLVPEVVSPRRRLSLATGHIDQGVDRLRTSLTSFRARSSAEVVIHTLPKGGFPQLGYCDWGSPTGAAHLHTYLNQKITGLCQDVDGVYAVDLAGLAEEIGFMHFRDERRRFFASYPASADAMTFWGILVADCIRAAKKGPRKVIVLDLDGTLWGGIVGEVGPLGVDVGTEYPGNAYLEFQRNLLDLKAQGVLLAICSKNDPEVALSVFKSHPHMAIRLDDIVSYQIGWNPKSEGLRQIALDLNLGLDSFVFIDDSPHERATIRHAFPEVLVPELPRDCVEYPKFLKSIRELWPLSLTESDLRRTELYLADKERRKLRAEYTDPRGYLECLEQVLRVDLIDAHEYKRVAQMHVRINQFNMTTRRYSEADLHGICSRGDRIYVGSLKDCFGDQGIVIAAVVVPEDGIWRLDSLLMSCRVMSRDVDVSFLKAIVDRARSVGVNTLLGEYVPTERNKPAATFYESFGFDGPSVVDDSSSQWWRLDTTVTLPETSTVRIVQRTQLQVSGEV